MATYTDTYEIEDETTYTDLEAAKRAANKLIEEGQGDSFEWTSEWYYEEDSFNYCREFTVDGGSYETFIEIL